MGVFDKPSKAIDEIYQKGFIVDNSPHFAVERLADGRQRLTLHPGIRGRVAALVLGCTDPAAINYNPLATQEDGSCIYPAGVTLVCDSISASKSKCGFVQFVDDDDGITRYYLTRDRSRDDFTQTLCPPGSVNEGSQTSTQHGESHDTCDPDTCEFSYDLSGSLDNAGCCDGPCDPEHIDNPSNTEARLNCCLPTYFWDTATVTRDSASCSSTLDSLPDFYSSSEQSCSLSDEFTTEMLIANVVAALPSYPDTWDGGCAAIRDLSEDETSYTEQSFKYKFTFEASASTRTLNWTDENGSPASESIGVGVTESSVYTVDAPGSNGTLSIDSGSAYWS